MDGLCLLSLDKKKKKKTFLEKIKMWQKRKVKNMLSICPSIRSSA